jgi:hypothetical protein
MNNVAAGPGVSAAVPLTPELVSALRAIEHQGEFVFVNEDGNLRHPVAELFGTSAGRQVGLRSLNLAAAMKATLIRLVLLCAIPATGCGASGGPGGTQDGAGTGGNFFDAGNSSGEGGSSTGGSAGGMDASIEGSSAAGSGGGTAGYGGVGESGRGGASGAWGGGGGGTTGGTGGAQLVYEATADGTPIPFFSLIVAQVSQDGQRFRFWLNGAQPSFRLTIDFVVMMGATQGTYSCGSTGTNSLSITYVSPTTGVEYATPPIAAQGSCSVHFTDIPANGTGRLAGTFSATLGFYRPPADAPGPWDMTPVAITDGVIDIPVPGQFRR